MSTSRVDVLLWANRVCARAATAAPHELLEITADTSLEAAQEAFHKIARVSHPDLHRGLLPDELEKVTTAYATIANAYQAYRIAKLAGRPAPPAPAPITAARPAARPATPPSASSPTSTRKPTEPPPVTGRAKTEPPSDFESEPVSSTSLTTSVMAAQQMSAKALVYYRKAEIGLRRGDLRGALLNLKLAIAADPQSQFLRQALSRAEQAMKPTP